MALLDILRYSISSLFWGLLIAITSMALFVFLIKGWYKDAQFSLSSYIVGLILFFLLSFQCILIVGSLTIISTSDQYESYIEQSVSHYDPNREVTLEESDAIIKNLIYEYPLLRYYIGGGEFTGYNIQQIPSAIIQELKSFMRWYIFRRLLWCIFFVVIGAVCVIKSMSSKYTSKRRVRPQRTDRMRVRRTRR